MSSGQSNLNILIEQCDSFDIIKNKFEYRKLCLPNQTQKDGFEKFLKVFRVKKWQTLSEGNIVGFSSGDFINVNINFWKNVGLNFNLDRPTFTFSGGGGASLDYINSILIKALKENFIKVGKSSDVHIQHYINESRVKNSNTLDFLIQPLDGTLVNPMFVDVINDYDYIITPSLYNKNQMIESGITKPITVIPNFFEKEESESIKRNKVKNKKFTFYSESSMITRKNVQNILRYFIESFVDTDLATSVKLIIKITTGKEKEDQLRQIINSYSGTMPEIVIVNGFLKQHELNEIWKSVDCYICLSYAEGFCIPALKAISCRIPVIALNSEISGYMDFLDKSNSILLPCKKIPIVCDSESLLIHSEHSLWEEADYDQYKKALRNVITTKFSFDRDISEFEKDEVVSKYNNFILKKIEDQKIKFTFNKEIDLTLCGNINLSEGLGKVINTLEKSILKTDLRYNIIDTNMNYGLDFVDFSPKNKGLHEIGKININFNFPNEIPPSLGNLNYIYSMYEADRIHHTWVKNINQYYDGVIVPDKWVKKVYEDSGVVKPIYIIPIGIEDNFKVDKIKDDIFTFGVNSFFESRKNHKGVIESFVNLYGNNNKYRLKVRGKGGYIYDNLHQEYKEYHNVEITCGELSSEELKQWYSDIDCYISASEGEGYSFTPREAILNEIPTIISNCATHETLVETGGILGIPVSGKKPSYKKFLFDCIVGNDYIIENKEIEKSMTEMVKNYHIYSSSVKKSKEWILNNENYEVISKMIKSFFDTELSEKIYSSNQDKVFKVTVLDIQPIDPPVGGSRLRLLGLYHNLGKFLPTTYVGSYDWQGENYRKHQLSETLEEINIPLSENHFVECFKLQSQSNNKTIIDSCFNLLGHHSSDFIKNAKSKIKESDIVVFSHPWVYPLVKDSLTKDHLVIYDSHNVEGVLRHELLDDGGGLGTEIAQNVIKIESELCSNCDLVLVCSDEDRELFNKLYNTPFSKISVVPNGVFTDKIKPVTKQQKEIIKKKLGLGSKPIIIFIGSSYQPNIEAAEFIVNELATKVPDVNFVICGGVSDHFKPDELRNKNNVVLTGFLNDKDKNNYLIASDIAINPMSSGSGTNVKMFEFMAAGLPIISTPVGARGIYQTEESIQICSLDLFENAIRKIIRNNDLSNSLGKNARSLVEEKYSWEKISRNLGLLVHRTKIHQAEKKVPLFSVIIPTYQRHDKLSALLNILQNQKSKDFEVIIIDQSKRKWNGLENYSDLDLVYIHTNVKGAVKARNAAAFFARGEILAFTDDDCEPKSDWLSNSIKYFENGNVVALEGSINSDKINDPRYRPVTNLGVEGYGFMTANLMVRRNVFMKIRGFDESFDNPHFREDTELGWRLLEQGQIPFAQDVCVYHPPHLRTIEGESLKERNRFFEKDALLFQKNPNKYKELFLKESHYKNTLGFRENFLNGFKKYKIEIDSFFLKYLNQ